MFAHKYSNARLTSNDLIICDLELVIYGSITIITIKCEKKMYVYNGKKILDAQNSES